MKKFLMFDLMLTPWIIRILYWIGQTYVIVGGLAGMFLPDAPFDIPRPWAGVILLIGGTLVLRLFFELLIVQFKIAENISFLKEFSKNDSSSKESIDKIE